jgi:hypothetical protein
MSTALASFKLHETRPKQSPAGVGATLAHNGIIRDILPPIVAELEGKISELQQKVNHILDEMQWHPNAIGMGVAHPALQAAAGAEGGRRTRRRKRV